MFGEWVASEKGLIFITQRSGFGVEVKRARGLMIVSELGGGGGGMYIFEN